MMEGGKSTSLSHFEEDYCMNILYIFSSTALVILAFTVDGVKSVGSKTRRCVRKFRRNCTAEGLKWHDQVRHPAERNPRRPSQGLKGSMAQMDKH